MELYSYVINSRRITQVVQAIGRGTELHQILPIVSELTFADIHHLSRELISMDIYKAVTEAVDQLGVVCFIEGFFEEGVTLLSLKILLEHLCQDKWLQVVLEVGELLVES